MQNGETDPELLLQRLRAEVRKRKAAVGLATRGNEPITASTTALENTGERPAQKSSAPLESKDHLYQVELALDRACSEEERSRKRPFFLRRIQRDQGKIDRSLAEAVQSGLEVLQLFRETFRILERELIDIHRFISAQEKQNAREEGQFQKLQKELQKQSANIQSQLRRELSEVRRFIQLQEQQNADGQRQYRGLQQRLTVAIEELQAQPKLEVAEVRDTFTGVERELTDIRSFISAQEKQTAEEQRQFQEHQKQIFDLTSKLIAYQAGTRALPAGEPQVQHERQLAEIQAFITAQEKQTAEEQHQLRESQQQLGEIRASVLPNVSLLRDRLNGLQGSFDLLLDHFVKRKRPLSRPVARSLDEELQHHVTDDFYVAFENEFRGSRESIKERLDFYLPIIREAKARTGDATALDVGCGRGEWLELLKENGFDGRGVDLNSSMVEECRSRGLEVECADANSYLRDVPSGSLSLITGFHIVEHLPFSQLLDLLRESFRVLRAGGHAIFETPNPECLQVTNYNFFLDPTHRNPIPQELLCFVARHAGFADTRVERLHPYSEEGVFKGYGDYAGIFVK